MAIVPTVRITFRQGGHTAFINVSDFDPQFHELYVDPEVKAAKVTETEILQKIVAHADAEEAAAKVKSDEEKVARRAAAIAKAQAAAKAKRDAAKTEAEVKEPEKK
jgi:hypothetical protein